MVLYTGFTWLFSGDTEPSENDEEEGEEEFEDPLEDGNEDQTRFLGTDEPPEEDSGHGGEEENRFDPIDQEEDESRTDSDQFVVEETGETTVAPDEKAEDTEDEELDDSGGEDYEPDMVRTPEPDTRSRRRGDTDEAFMELPTHSVLELEEVDADASVKDLLPDVLPGWKRVKTDTYRWQIEEAEDRINATYLDPYDDRYMVHVSRWQPEHVQYVIDELFSMGEPTRFDVWTARGRFVFGVKIAGGTVPQAKTLLTASPALSESYFQLNKDKGGRR